MLNRKVYYYARLCRAFFLADDFLGTNVNRGTQDQFSKNICSEDDLRSRIFRTFLVKFIACLPLLGFSNI